MPPIILASKSPARKKILSDLGYDFTIIPSDFNEFFDSEKTPQENALMLAKGKAEDVFTKLSETDQQKFLVIGVDTIIVDSNTKLLEKPKNRQDAQDMMSTRSGKTEILISGICMIHGNTKFSAYEETKMTWQEMSSEKIQKILETEEWKGKCGGVAIEGFTGLHIAEISGNYSNVMGFPVNKFLEGLQKLQNS